MARILIIDDDEGMRYTLSALVESLGHTAFCAPNLDQGIETALSVNLDVVFLDVMLPDGNGLSALPVFRACSSKPEIIIITGYGSADGAEVAIQMGAWDYIQKGASFNQMKLTLTRALEYREEKAKQKLPTVISREGIIGNSSCLQECIELLAHAANCDASVLITGDTGTGKELFARAIHKNSKRKERDFVVVDCAALPENLVESVLFGHEKGSFTGADKAREGLVKQADGGTLFLDEVGELPLKIQKAFLRVLQEHCFRPIGGKRELRSDFRLISATNQDLNQMASKGLFREDLLFRLQSLTIHIPPLRDRSEDIEELARYYVDKLCLRYGLKAKDFSDEFLVALKTYAWPGNVRELINALETAISMASDLNTLYPIHLPIHIRAMLARASVKAERTVYEQLSQNSHSAVPDLQSLLDATERQYLKDILSFAGWDVKKACSLSGLSRSRFYERLKKHGITRPSKAKEDQQIKAQSLRPIELNISSNPSSGIIQSASPKILHSGPRQ